MKKVLSLLLVSLFLISNNVSLFGQNNRTHGILHAINNAPINGAYNVAYDATTSIITIDGLATTFGMSISTNPISKIEIPSTPAVGLAYNLENPTFGIINVTKINEYFNKNKVNVYGLDFYTLYKNETVRFDSQFVGSPTNTYTLILQANGVPVAYSTFIPIPEPLLLTLFSTMCLASVFVFRKRKLKAYY